MAITRAVRVTDPTGAAVRARTAWAVAAVGAHRRVLSVGVPRLGHPVGPQQLQLRLSRLPESVWQVGGASSR